MIYIHVHLFVHVWFLFRLLRVSYGRQSDVNVEAWEGFAWTLQEAKIFHFEASPSMTDEAINGLLTEKRLQNLEVGLKAQFIVHWFDVLYHHLSSDRHISDDNSQLS